MKTVKLEHREYVTGLMEREEAARSGMLTMAEAARKANRTLWEFLTRTYGLDPQEEHLLDPKSLTIISKED